VTVQPRSLWLPLLLAGGIAVALWWHTRFLVDDAYIVFRYVDNAMAGHGLCWNRPPFLPVEGYSCFLWAVLLWLVWATTGVEPPVASNVLSLCFGLGTLALCAHWLRPRIAASRWRSITAVLVLAGIASQPTFVTWLSSGLETAMFTFFVVAWVLLAASPQRRDASWTVRLCGAAALAALSRPDGLLMVLASPGVVLLRGGRWRAAWSLLLPFVHLLWRHAYYGDWLPNTWYAKVVTAWPESGLRYLFCFACEHGVFPWALLAAGWVGTRPWRRCAAPGQQAWLAPGVAAAVVLAQVACYTLQVGGDHFGYRVFCHLVPLLYGSALLFVQRLCRHSGGVALLLAGFVLLANGWSWLHESALAEQYGTTFAPLASRVPAIVRPLVREFDRCQAWLCLHFVGLPRGLHAAFLDGLRRSLPDREQGRRIPGDGLPVIDSVNVGLLAWALPNVAVIDRCGLNDWVVARTPPPRPLPLPLADALPAVFARFDGNHDGRLDRAELHAAVVACGLAMNGSYLDADTWVAILLAIHDGDDDGALSAAEFAGVAASLQPDRLMAHERQPPAGYVAAFRPNVRITPAGAVVEPRALPLTAEELRAIERRLRHGIGAPH